MIWPDRPQVHDSDYRSQSPLAGGRAIWRDARVDLKYGRRDPFRTCSFCGSIHPEDLYAHLSTTTADRPLGGSDWKYGWPHKFYVEGIPNGLAGRPCQIGSTSYALMSCPSCGHRWGGPGESTDRCPKCQSGAPLVVGREDRPIMGTGAATAHAKFYSEHLLDLQPEAFVALTDLIYKFARIQFERNDDGQLLYSAPRSGFQV